MNSSSKELVEVYKAFPKAFINCNNEMIVYPPKNIYFLLDNVHNKLELDCKVLEWCSREASKGLGWQSRRYHMDGIQRYFGRNFTQEEMDWIYTKLGNGINRKLCVAYIESDFDISLIKNKKEQTE